MHRYMLRLRSIILSEEQTIIATGLLLLLCVAMFSVALSFVPAKGDDLILLSSVANRKNPFSYFVGGWGLGNNAYRPLHSIFLWLIYRAFGISALPNQLINIALHFVSILLLFRIIQRFQPDRVVSFLLASLSPNIWGGRGNRNHKISALVAIYSSYIAINSNYIWISS